MDGLGRSAAGGIRRLREVVNARGRDASNNSRDSKRLKTMMGAVISISSLTRDVMEDLVDWR